MSTSAKLNPNILRIKKCLIEFLIFTFLIYCIYFPVTKRLFIGTALSQNILLMIICLVSFAILIMSPNFRSPSKVLIVIPIIASFSAIVTQSAFSLFRLISWILFCLGMSQLPSNYSYLNLMFRISKFFVLMGLLTIPFSQLSFYSDTRFPLTFFNQRLTGIDSYSNALGVLSGFLFIYSLYLKPKHYRLYIILSFLVTYLTETRSVLIVIFSSFTFRLLFLKSHSISDFFKSLTSLSFFSYLFFRFLVFPYFSQFSNLNQVDDRSAVWLIPWKVWKEQKLTGYGFSWYENFPEQFQIAGVVNPHNSYLNLLVTSGLIGFIFFAVAVIRYVFLCLRSNDPFLMNTLLFLLIVGFTEPCIEFSFGNESSVLFLLFFTHLRTYRNIPDLK